MYPLPSLTPSAGGAGCIGGGWGGGGSRASTACSRTRGKENHAQVEPPWPTSRGLDVTELGEKLGHLVLSVEVVRALTARFVSKITVPVMFVASGGQSQ